MRIIKKEIVNYDDFIPVYDLGVSGEYHNFCLSNGVFVHNSGKSTIISALFWALTNSSLTNEVLADEVVNLQTGKNCRVSVYISTDKDEIKVTRVRKDTEHGNNLFLEINGQDLSCHKVADTQDRINKLIKIPFSLLKSTIIMTSGMESAFSSLSPQDRINTLESIRDYSIWEKIRDEANKDSKLYTSEITNNNLEISNLTGKIDTYKSLIRKAEQDKNNLETNGSIEQIDTEITKAKETKELQVSKIKEKEEEFAVFKATIREVDSSTITQKMSAIVDEVNELKSQVTKEKQDIDNQIRDLEYKRKDIEREVNLIERWFKEDTCPTCNRKLDRTEEEIQQKTALLNQYKAQITTLSDSISTYQAKKLNSQLEVEINAKIDAKRAEYSNLQNNLNNIKTIKIEVDKKKDRFQAELTELNTNVSRLEIQLNTWLNKRNNYLTDLNRYKTDIETYKNSIDENMSKIKELQIKNEDLTAKKYLSDFYYKLLGAKGELRPYLLSKDIAYLNNRMQSYINRFFKNTEVNLILNGNAIDIKIHADGVVKGISSLSGGEKKRIDISIQLALYDLIQTVSQSKFNLLCLDEIESLLDPIGCEQLIEIIEDKAENIETVWWITNHPSVKETIPHKIIAKKILGKTEVEEI